LLQFNERKILTLRFAVQQDEPFTADDLAAALDLEAHNARMLCLKYVRQEILMRRKQKGAYQYEYAITEKRLRRLEFFKQTMPEVYSLLVDGGVRDTKDVRRHGLEIFL